MAPLLREKNGEIQLDGAIVALTIGLLTSGLIFLFASHLGVSGKASVLIFLLTLALLNLFRYRLLLVPQFSSLRISNLVGYGFLFFIYAGTTVVASLKSGYGDYPYVFFNVDAPYRLSTIYELLNGKLSLSNLGYQIPVNHHGGPALAATLSLLTGVTINKALFILSIPMVALGTFCCFTVTTRALGLRGEKRILSILLFSSTVFFGDLIWKLVSTPIDLTTLQMIGGIVNHHQTHFIHPNGWALKGPSTIVYQTSFFILGVWFVFAVQQGMQRLIGYGVIILIALMSKIDTLIPIVMFALIQTSASLASKRNLFFCLSLAIAIISVVIYIFFSFGYNTFNYRFYFDFGGLFEKQLSVALSLSFDLLLLILGYLTVKSNHANSKIPKFSLLAISGVTLLFPLLIFNLVNFQVWSSTGERIDSAPISHFYTTPYWTVLPFCVAVLLIGKPPESIFKKSLMTIYLVPFIVAAIFISIGKLENVVRQLYIPESMQDYVYTRNIGELLKLVPTKGTLLVTNDFRHPASNFDRDLQHMVLPSLFGHQWFAVNYMTYRGVQNDTTIHNRMKLQKEVLSGDEDTMLRVAKKYGWTHYLEHIELAPIRRQSLRLLGENRAYRLYKFPD